MGQEPAGGGALPLSPHPTLALHLLWWRDRHKAQPCCPAIRPQITRPSWKRDLQEVQGRSCPLPPPPPQALTVLKLGKRLSGDAPLRRKVRKCLMSSGECSGRPGIGSDARRGLLCPEGPGGRGRAASARGGTACVETGHGEHLSAAIGCGVTAHAVHRCGIRGAPALPLRCYIGWNPPRAPPCSTAAPRLSSAGCLASSPAPL